MLEKSLKYVGEVTQQVDVFCVMVLCWLCGGTAALSGVIGVRAARALDQLQQQQLPRAIKY